jgi:hypothetical protein
LADALKFHIAVGGPFHGMTIDDDLVIEGRADLDDGRSRFIHPVPYTVRRLEIDSPMYRWECLAPEEMTDEQVRATIEAKGMTRMVLVRKVN